MNRKFYFFLSISAILLPELLRAQLRVAITNIGVEVSSSQSLVISMNAASRTPLSDKIDNVENVKFGDINVINVFSNGKFVLKVSARNDFHNMDGAEIPPSAVYVSSGAVQGKNYNNKNFVFEKDVNLAIDEPKALIHAQTYGSLNNSFDIEYYASGLGYKDLHHGNLDGTIVYTIEVE